MDFPIVDLFDDDLSIVWLQKYFHPRGQKCPHCGKSMNEARVFRKTRKSGLVVYRCNHCAGIYNVYSETVFEGRQLRPSQVILLLRAVCKGEPTAQVAREIGVSRQTAHDLRKLLQENGKHLQTDAPLEDQRTETDEMFQNAGEKR
jgi:transposase-like protein